MSDQGGSIDFERVLEEIQRQLMEQARAIYSDHVVEHAYHPRNLGRLEWPDAYQIVDGSCGDSMEMFLRVGAKGTDEERIEEITFMTDGCGTTLACGSMLTTMVQGMSLEEAGQIEPEDLLEALGGLPEASVHCASLAVMSLRETIAHWYRRTRRQGRASDGDRRI
jgi:nitrogen fixation NifU-like protein